MNWSTRCFPTPLPISADNTYTSFSPLSLPHARTHLRPWVTCRLFWCAFGSITGGGKWVTRGSCPIFRELLFVVTRVWRGPAVLCLTSQWIMVPTSPPRHPFSPSVCPSVLDHWLTQYCLRLIAKGSRLGAKGLLTLASAVEEGVGSLKGFAECTDSLLH